MAKLLIVNFHYIRTDFTAPYPGIFGITPKKFEEQLKILGSFGRFISQDELYRSLKAEKTIKGNSILITFDDGLKEQYLNALPILEELSIPCIFFANSQNVIEDKISLVHKIHRVFAHSDPKAFMERCYCFSKERSKSWNNITDAQVKECYPYDTPQRGRLKFLLNYELTLEEQAELIEELHTALFAQEEKTIARELYMNEQELSHLSDLGMLGSHSHQHVPLSTCDSDSARKNILSSLNHFEDITGRRPMSISYPYGSPDACNSITFSLCRKLGLQLGFTMERKLNSNISDPLSLGRFDCNDVPGGKSPILTEDFFF